MGSVGEGLPIIWRKNTNPVAFDEARVGRVFNHRRPDRQPCAVVSATKESHVVEAIRLARQNRCRVSVRSGGHSWAAWSVRNDAILIDLGNYQYLDFDERAMTVVVSPSTTGRVLNGYLGDRGYMFAGGHCPDVGVGGFLLQGGMGWNCKNWGWAAESVLAVDCVSAEGELLRCDPSQHQDLYWAARGCGPGFPAVVIKFHLRVRKSYTNMLSSSWVYPISRYREVMDWVVNVSEGYDEDTEVVAVGCTPSDTPGIAERCIIALFVTFKNSDEEARAALEAANASRPEGFKIAKPNEWTSLANEYRNQASANPQGHRYCAENAYITNGKSVSEVLEEAFTTLPHPKAFALWYSMHPCSRRELPDMALSMQSDHYFALYTVWEDASDDDRCLKWVRDVMRKVEPHSDGAYLGDSDFQVRKTRFWKDANARKLMEIRQKYDPEGLVCGYLDKDDQSGVNGLSNESEWLVHD